VTDVAAWTDRLSGEAEFLAGTWDRLAGSALVTFHGKGFDIPVLELRSLKHAVPIPGWFAARHAGVILEHHDLKEILSAHGAAPAAPLDLYAKLVGLPGKEGVAGADVQDLYAQGALGRIAAYCMTDVVQTFLLFLRHRLVDGAITHDGYAESAAMLREELPALFERRLPAEQRGVLEGFVERCAPFFGAAEPALRVG
jgi:3'-5' exonuclease